MINQILLAINFMHTKNMTHRDLKPENVLMASTDKNNLDIKITDFGFATFFNKDEGLEQVLGSPLYMAPELCVEETYNNKVDIWSIGVIAYVLVHGKPPFFDRNKDRIFDQICRK